MYGGVGCCRRVHGAQVTRNHVPVTAPEALLWHSGMPPRESTNARGGGESRRTPLYALLALFFAWAVLLQLQLVAMQQVCVFAFVCVCV